MGFKDDLAAAKEHVSERVVTPHIPVTINGTLYTVLFVRASTEDWAHATVKHRPRGDVELDLTNGYNMTGATREIAPKYGRIVEGDVESTLTVEEWADFWEVMPPKAARFMEANVWFLHERDADMEIEAAKKASKPRPASRKKPS